MNNQLPKRVDNEALKTFGLVLASTSTTVFSPIAPVLPE